MESSFFKVDCSYACCPDFRCEDEIRDWAEYEGIPTSIAGLMDLACTLGRRHICFDIHSTGCSFSPFLQLSHISVTNFFHSESQPYFSVHF